MQTESVAKPAIVRAADGKLKQKIYTFIFCAHHFLFRFCPECFIIISWFFFWFSTAHLWRWTNASTSIAHNAGSSDCCPRTTNGEFPVYFFFLLLLFPLLSVDYVLISPRRHNSFLLLLFVVVYLFEWQTMFVCQILISLSFVFHHMLLFFCVSEFVNKTKSRYHRPSPFLSARYSLFQNLCPSNNSLAIV